eukprot:3528362-Amphidinium_carterae.1
MPMWTSIVPQAFQQTYTPNTFFGDAWEFSQQQVREKGEICCPVIYATQNLHVPSAVLSTLCTPACDLRELVVFCPVIYLSLPYTLLVCCFVAFVAAAVWLLL